MSDYNIEGFVDDRFAAVREAFEDNLKSGKDIGNGQRLMVPRLKSPPDWP